MSHIENTGGRAMIAVSATVLSFAFAGGLLANVFADGPDEKIEVGEPDVTIVGGPFAHTGSQICPTDLIVTAWDGEDILLDKDVDYTFTCGENIEIGSESGMINISSVSSSLYSFDDFSINFPIWKELRTISYDVTALEVTYGDEKFEGFDNLKNPLTVNDDYGNISYSSSDDSVASVDNDGNITLEAGGETVITAIAEAVEDEEIGEGIATYTLKVNKKGVSVTSATVDDKTYDGTTVGVVDDYEIDDDDIAMYEAVATFEDANAGKDKNVTVSLKLDNDEAKRYEVKNSYTTTATIDPYVIEDSDASLSQDEYTYSGSENKPSVNVSIYAIDGVNDMPLVEGEDFTVNYPSDTTSAGDKVVTISADGNFAVADDFELYYSVEPYELTASNVTLEYNVTDYDGTAKEPGVTVKIDDFTVDSSEYTVTYDDNVDAGTALVTVTAKDNANIYSYAEKNFEITEKQVVTISGISSQTVTYTGSPVELVGDLTISGGPAGITTENIEVEWFSKDNMLLPIDRPKNVGTYVAKFSYEDDDYIGVLSVEFSITKAVSPMPAEMYAGFRVEKGDALDFASDDYTKGFEWVDSTASVAPGLHTYAATYTYDNDADNYTTLNLNVPVYGYAVISIYASVDTDGGDVEYPDEAIEGEAFNVRFLPEASYELKSVMLNGMEVTSSVKDNILRITAGTTDVDILASFRRVYNTIEGEGMNYVIGAGRLASFRFNVDHDLFVNGGKVYIDGQLIGEGYYTHTSGSTIITLSEELLNLFGNGDHTIAVVFGDGGIARASFSVAGATGESPIKTPNTGFFSGVIGGVRAISITALIFAGIASVVVYRKKFAGKRVDFDKK